MKTLLCRTSARLAVGLAFTISCVTADAIERYVSLTGGHVPPFLSWDAAATNIQAAVDAAVDGDTIWVTNGVYATGAQDVYGMSNRVAVTKAVILQSVNGPDVTTIKGNRPIGTTAIRCVYLTNGAVLSGFTLTNGATQNTGDQGKLLSGGGVWCESVNAVVTNCVLVGNVALRFGGGAYSGTLNNCLVRSNSQATFGGGACLATLNYCTLTGNSSFGNGQGGGADQSLLTNCILTFNSGGKGGGASFSTLYRCVLTNNLVPSGSSAGGAFYCTLYSCVLAANKAWDGGGAYGGTLVNCLVFSNSASVSGGGAATATLINCSLAGNSASSSGGGAFSCVLLNCIAYFNNCATGPNYHFPSSGMNYCCTTPLATNGAGNFTNAPLFVDYAGGNLRLQSNSPCINAGNNGSVATSTDLDGDPRIVGTTVDVGAYEFQSPASTLSYAWAQQYGLPTDGSADTLDSDGDGLNNWQESRCLTDPTNALSVLRLLSATPSGTNVTVSWQSVPRLSYFLERSSDLTATPRFTPLATNVTGWTGATTTFTDTNAASGSPRFYRVGVGN